MNVDEYLPRPLLKLIILFSGHFVKGWKMYQFLSPQALKFGLHCLDIRMVEIAHRDKYQLPSQSNMPKRLSSAHWSRGSMSQ